MKVLPSLALLITASFPMGAFSAEQTINLKVLQVNSNSSSELLIYLKSDPESDPGPCGSTWWRYSSSANGLAEVQAGYSLALAAYVAGKPLVVNLSGCDGTYNQIWSLQLGP